MSKKRSNANAPKDEEESQAADEPRIRAPSRSQRAEDPSILKEAKEPSGRAASRKEVPQEGQPWTAPCRQRPAKAGILVRIRRAKAASRCSRRAKVGSSPTKKTPGRHPVNEEEPRSSSCLKGLQRPTCCSKRKRQGRHLAEEEKRSRHRAAEGVPKPASCKRRKAKPGIMQKKKSQIPTSCRKRTSKLANCRRRTKLPSLFNNKKS